MNAQSSVSREGNNSFLAGWKWRSGFRGNAGVVVIVVGISREREVCMRDKLLWVTYMKRGLFINRASLMICWGGVECIHKNYPLFFLLSMSYYYKRAFTIVHPIYTKKTLQSHRTARTFRNPSPLLSLYHYEISHQKNSSPRSRKSL